MAFEAQDLHLAGGWCGSSRSPAIRCAGQLCLLLRTGDLLPATGGALRGAVLRWEALHLWAVSTARAPAPSNENFARTGGGVLEEDFGDGSMSRMWQLIEIEKHRKLTDEEKAELQRLFLRVAENDVRLLRDETGQAARAERDR